MKIKNLALGGGGIFGYAEIGALSELEKYDEYIEIESITGTSVGSIVAGLWAVGYSMDELIKIIFDFDFEALIKDAYVPPYNLYEYFGMYEAKKLEEKIEELIEQKTHIKNCTFSQIDKDLTVVVTNINQQKAYFCNKETFPDLPISKAIRMSAGYPIIMIPVKYNDDYWGDGGDCLNYPITRYTDLDKTIGITFAAYNENMDGTLKNKVIISDIYEYVISLATTFSRSAYIAQITPEYFKRSIVVQITEPVSSTQFNITNEQKKKIFDCGVTSVKEQINAILGIKN